MPYDAMLPTKRGQTTNVLEARMRNSDPEPEILHDSPCRHLQARDEQWLCPVQDAGASRTCQIKVERQGSFDH